mgnify:CR=1 FL=1
MIKSEMIYTKQVFNDFAVYNIKKNKEMKFIYICAAIILAFTIVMFTVGDIISGIIYGVIGIIFACYGWFMKIIINHNNKKNIGTTDVYEFYDDKLVVSSHDKKGAEIATASLVYSRLYKVVEYKNYAYIYVNKAVAYIIEKNAFENEQEFKSVLEKISTEILNQKIKNATPVVYGGYNVVPPNEETIKDVSDPVPPPVQVVEEAPDINEITDDVDINAQTAEAVSKNKRTKTSKPKATKSSVKKTTTKKTKVHKISETEATLQGQESLAKQQGVEKIEIDDIDSKE